MSCKTRTHVACPTALAAILSALLVAGVPPAAHATGSFSATADPLKQVFCGLATIKGDVTATESRYSATGDCSELQAPHENSDRRSEFAGAQGSIEIFHAAWSAEGTYNPVTKETWERLTMPAPNIDQKTPVGRPYGHYETRMICATDPWLTGIGVACTGKTVSATGNLGDVEALLRQLNRPATTPNKPAMLQALVAAHARQERLLTPVTKTETNGKAGAIAYAFAPTIVEPRDGSTHPPQTPLRVRIAPAKNAKDTAYELELQFQANFDWRAITTVPVTAALAQSAEGYRGWGGHTPGTGAQMTAAVGTYRIRARATLPQRGAPGDWVEFKIDGQPGIQIDTMARAAPAPLKSGDGASARLEAARVGASRSAADAVANAPGVAVKNKANAVLLNPQPLPPKTAMPNALQPASPFDAARSKANAVTLNPQPLPPGGLQQAPSALR